MSKSASASVQATSETSSRLPRWVMRLIAATLVPLLFLGVFELGLRAIGYGYSTDFFEPREIGGEPFLVPNRKFTHRFFPPALARTPLPMRMDAEKPEGTFRIFLFGESAAYGDPDPSFGVGRYLEALLETRYPETDFDVVCVAITAINSHVILPIARDCARRDGDLWIIYMGNNEMVGPFGAGTVFGQRAPHLGVVRAGLALKSTRLGQLLSATANSLQSGDATPESWGGIDMFSENQLRHDDPDRLRAYENFAGNLEDILQVGTRAGVPIILSTVASNLRDCSPFASLHSPRLEGRARAEWDRLFAEGNALEAAGSFEAALVPYTEAAALDPDFAELQFRLGTCHLAAGDPEKALAAFARARDHDALAVRADSRINQIIREAIARPRDGTVSGVDAVAALARLAPDGIPGQALFYEHVHLTMEGNLQLARLLAANVADQLPPSVAASGGPGDPATEAEACAQRLAATLWDQKRVWNKALLRIAVSPFTTQSSHSRNTAYCRARMDAVDARTTPGSPAQDRLLYESALQLHPDDTQVRWNYAQFFEKLGFLPEAIEQGRIICELLPHAPYPHYFVGSLLAREGQADQAATYFRRALAIDPHFSSARTELRQLESHL